MTLQKRKRGRPRKVRPFFIDEAAEAARVAACLAEGREPYPPVKHKPCEAERELRKEIEPGVPFDLALELLGDENGVVRPKALQRWTEAKATQAKNGAKNTGGERTNRAALVIWASKERVLERLSIGHKKSDILRELNRSLKRNGKQQIGEKQFYPAIKRFAEKVSGGGSR